MENILYNKPHIREYITFGFIAAMSYVIPVWIFLHLRDYHYTEILFLGSVLFMFVIMAYCIKLSRRRPEYKSAWMMIVAASMAVLIGIVISVLLCLLLCAIYIPGFITMNPNGPFLKNAPSGYSAESFGTIFTIFTTATVENFGVGGFMAVMAPYVFKFNQTKDKTVLLDKEVKRG